MRKQGNSKGKIEIIREWWKELSWGERIALGLVLFALASVLRIFWGVEGFSAVGVALIFLLGAAIASGMLTMCSEEAKAIVLIVGVVLFFSTLSNLGASLNRYALAVETLDSLQAKQVSGSATKLNDLHDKAIEACIASNLDLNLEVTREAVIGAAKPPATPILGLLVGNVRPSRCLGFRDKILAADPEYFGK